MNENENIKIDFKAHEFESGNGKYQSIIYQMNTANPYKQKELDKTYYIKDIKTRIERMRELLGDNNHNSITATARQSNLPDFKKHGFKDISKFYEKQNQGMFYGVWVEVATLRKLEIESYLQDIFNNAKEIKNEAKVNAAYSTNDLTFNAVCYLIDQQYKMHTGVLSDSVSDALYSDEYNQIIYDYIAKMIKNISAIDIELEKAESEILPIKKIKWKGNINELFTVFSDLKECDLIETEKANLARFICSNFKDKENKEIKFSAVNVYLSKETKSKKRVDLSDFG